MKNIIKDIKTNCPECECDIEKTVEFLCNRGDFSYISEHHREVWFFYLDALKEFEEKEARNLTIEMFRLTYEKFSYIRRKYREVVSHV